MFIEITDADAQDQTLWVNATKILKIVPQTPLKGNNFVQCLVYLQNDCIRTKMTFFTVTEAVMAATR